MDQHLVAAAVVPILPRDGPLAVLVHVQEVAEDRDLLGLWTLSTCMQGGGRGGGYYVSPLRLVLLPNTTSNGARQ